MIVCGGVHGRVMMEVCEWVVVEVASAREDLGHREVGARVQLAVQVGEHRVLERRELVVVEGHLEAVVMAV